jgi:predicted kinase
MAAMPELIHLNGPPGIGKSTVAAALVDHRPLALNLDIDELRRSLGQWRRRDESKHLARDLGFRLAASHLDAGHDVVLPQLLVRPEVVDQLRGIAADAGARFTEVVLLGSADVCVARVAADEAAGRVHPRHVIDPEELRRRVMHACEALTELARASAAIVIEADGGVEETVRVVERALAAGR